MQAKLRPHKYLKYFVKGFCLNETLFSRLVLRKSRFCTPPPPLQSVHRSSDVPSKAFKRAIIHSKRRFLVHHRRRSFVFSCPAGRRTFCSCRQMARDASPSNRTAEAKRDARVHKLEILILLSLSPSQFISTLKCLILSIKVLPFYAYPICVGLIF